MKINKSAELYIYVFVVDFKKMLIHKKYLADFLLVSIAIVWGASYSLTKGALDFTPVLLFLVIRFGVTFLLLLPFTIKNLLKSSKKSLIFGSLLSLVLSGIFLAETYGIPPNSGL